MFRHRDDPKDPIRASLGASVIDGSAYSIMVGLGETYLPAFVLAVGLGEIVAGLVATVPMLAGAILQLISPAVIRYTGSRRRWVILCATLQGLAFLPLCLAAWRGMVPAWSVLIVATVYWGTAMAAGSAWNTWMSHLVPPRLRTPFFARRTRFAQGFVMVGLVFGGLTLHVTKTGGAPLAGFVVVFAIACASRLISSYFLVRQVEPMVDDFVERRVPLARMVGRLRRREGSLMVYMAAVQITSQLSAPYFTPFMMEKLKYSYLLYLAMLGISFLSKSLTMAIWGRVARRGGAKKLLWIGGVGIVPLSIMWIVSGSPVYLLPSQILAGALWGAYELATMLLLFDAIKDDERTSVLTTFNLVNSAAIVTGAVLGGILLRALDNSHQAYLLLFTLSSLARAAALLLLRRVDAVAFQPAPFTLRDLTVRPSAGSVVRPILTSDDDPDSRERLSRSRLSLLGWKRDDAVPDENTEGR